MKNEMTEQTRENVSSELNWIAKTYLSMANEITYTENIEDFIESLLSMETYIDKVVRELRK